MRNWHFIIPIIAVAVWILSSLIKGNEEQVRRPRPRPEPDEPPPDRPRRAPSEIDRFLQEVQRRRKDKDGEERRKDPERRAEPVMAEIPRAIPVEPILIPEPLRRASGRHGERASKRRSVEVPPVVVQEVPPPAALATSGSFWQPPAQAAQPTAARAAGTPAQQTSASRQLLALLRSPQSLGTAFLLREVLDRPLSMRRRL